MTAFRISAAGLLFSLVTISSAAAVPAAPQALLTPPSDIVQVQSKVQVCKKVAVGPCGPGYGALRDEARLRILQARAQGTDEGAGILN